VCRLFGFRATAPTRVEDCLVHAPNSLLVQSRRDLRGFEHADGWGIVAYAEDGPRVERQPFPAHDGKRFRAAAGRIEAATVVAHVRRATVGVVALENTHPFGHGRWSFAHNGTVPYFDTIREELLAALGPDRRAAIHGSTDSEHLFHLILARHEQTPAEPLLESLRWGLCQVVAWCRAVGQEPHLGLNVLLTDGVRMVGSRWQRTLHYLDGPAALVGGLCAAHLARPGGERYRALMIASEPLNDASWPEVPERSIFEVTPELGLRIAPLEG